MNRKEKIELLKSIQSGTPLNLALSEHITLYDTLEDEGVFFDANGNPADIVYYKKHCKNLSFITAINADEMKKIMNCQKRIIESEKK
ncbi:MAG: hypothetical protein M0R16_08975 [Bacteroidales bacterium]|jgi:hypothetical protein|nr:hypothetical protein [Bacteroidales bacterium]